jgi:hypothetical protein
MQYVARFTGNPPSEILQAFDSTPLDYAEFILNTRNPTPTSSGSVFLVPQTWESLRSAAWEPYNHPEVQAPARAYRAPIPGLLGIVRISELAPGTKLRLSDPKGTGFVEAEVPGVMGGEVGFTVALVGPSRETGAPSLWTLFPGDPIMPSRMPSEGNVGRVVTAEEAMRLGFEWGKIVSGAALNPYRNPKEFTFLARQGQHHDVERVLHSLGIRYCTEPMSHFGRGAYGRTGFLVKAEIPEGMSKRSINRALYEAGVPGATRSGAPKRANPHVRSNPWFSPPAMQYVARFTGNPPVQIGRYDREFCAACGEPLLAGSDAFYSPKLDQYFCNKSHARAYRTRPDLPADEVLARQRRASVALGMDPDRKWGPEWGRNPPGYGSSLLEYDSYEAPPGHEVFHNPTSFRAGERVTWSPEAIELEIGRPGQVMRVRYPGRHADDAERTSVEFDSGRSRMVNNWEIVRVHANPPGYGSSLLEYDSYEAPPGHEVFHNPTHQVLCGCGWGNLAMEESEIPDYCPVCEQPVGVCGSCGERKSDCECYDSNPPVRRNACYGVHFKQDKPFNAQGLIGMARQLPGPGSPMARPIHEYLDNPAASPKRMLPASQFGMAAAWRRGEEGELEGDMIVIRGREVPVEHSAKGAFHHVRVADPSEFKAIRTKVLSAKKGIKARVGIFKGRGPRGGKSEIQSYLFDAKQYTPQDVARWIEGHKTPAPLLVQISSATPSKRRMKVYGKEAEAPRKARKSVKKKAKKKPRALPAAAKRCTAKTKAGRCKGYKQAGKQQCALHSAGVAGKRQPKKKKTKKRKVG